MDYSDDEYDSDDGDILNEILGPEDLFDQEADDGEKDRHDGEDDGVEDKTGGKPDQDIKPEKQAKVKKIVRNPRVRLNFDTLNGPNGLKALKKDFANFKFKGTNHEKEDLARIMKILQNWMRYRLCPSYDFESAMTQLEILGKKKNIQTLMRKYRMGLDEWGGNNSDNESNKLPDNAMDVDKGVDEFDLLMNEQMATIDSEDEDDGFGQSEVAPSQTVVPTGNPSQTNQNEQITAEQLERIARNRKLAEERRLQRMSQLEPKQLNTT